MHWNVMRPSNSSIRSSLARLRTRQRLSAPLRREARFQSFSSGARALRSEHHPDATSTSGSTSSQQQPLDFSKWPAPTAAEHFVRTLPCAISHTDLATPSEKFDKLQRTLSQRLIHATHPKSAHSILEENFLFGGGGGQYDGKLFTDPLAPRSAFAQIRPESEGLIFPFSLYPKDVPAGGSISICTFDMDFLASDNYVMFHHRTDRVLLDPRLSPVAQSQIVFVCRDDKEALEYAERELTLLDKRTCSILQHSDTSGWSMATRFLRAVTHNIVVVFLGGLRIEPNMKVNVIDGTRLARVKGLFYCHFPGCDYSISSVRLFKDHYRSSHAEVKYACDQCDKSFASQSGLQLHERTAHDEDFLLRCKVVGCSFATKYPSTLDAHARAHDGIRSFKCAVDGCDFGTNYGHLLARHMKINHSDTEYRCTIDGCTFTTNNAKTFEKHGDSHRDVKKFTCVRRECQFSTNSGLAMNRHVAVKHSQSDFKCNECGVILKTPEGLRVHTRVQHEDYRLYCDHIGCDYVSGYSGRLIEHRHVMHKGRILYCPKCTFVCLYQREFDAHRKKLCQKTGAEQESIAPRAINFVPG